jgi:hypothetical protein
MAQLVPSDAFLYEENAMEMMLGHNVLFGKCIKEINNLKMLPDMKIVDGRIPTPKMCKKVASQIAQSPSKDKLIGNVTRTIPVHVLRDLHRLCNPPVGREFDNQMIKIFTTRSKENPQAVISRTDLERMVSSDTHFTDLKNHVLGNLQAEMLNYVLLARTLYFARAYSSIEQWRLYCQWAKFQLTDPIETYLRFYKNVIPQVFLQATSLKELKQATTFLADRYRRISDPAEQFEIEFANKLGPLYRLPPLTRSQLRSHAPLSTLPPALRAKRLVGIVHSTSDSHSVHVMPLLRPNMDEAFVIVGGRQCAISRNCWADVLPKQVPVHFLGLLHSCGLLARTLSMNMFSPFDREPNITIHQ